jgi:hypothetical protein
VPDPIDRADGGLDDSETAGLADGANGGASDIVLPEQAASPKPNTNIATRMNIGVLGIGPAWAKNAANIVVRSVIMQGRHFREPSLVRNC